LSKAGGLGLSDALASAFARQQGLTKAALAPIEEGKARTVAREEAPAHPSAATLVLPDAAVTSDFGWRSDPFSGQLKFHAGTDLRMAYGDVVKAPAAGTVTFAGEQSGYGLTVVVDHGGGRETLLAHLSGFDVKPGDRVEGGQPIARSGNSGRATGAHLHVEVREFGRPVDPRQVASEGDAGAPAGFGSRDGR
jgi:murein DD-endopeptidase MepM/ murein hydrolase activator NlpD